MQPLQAFDSLTRRQAARATRLFKDMDMDGTRRLSYEQIQTGMEKHYPRYNIYKLIKGMNPLVLDRLYLGGTIAMEVIILSAFFLLYNMP